MVLAALLLLNPLAMLGDVVLPVAKAPETVASSSSTANFSADSSAELPMEFLIAGVPAPALSADFSTAMAAQPTPAATAAESSSIEAGPAIQPVTGRSREFILQPVKVASRHGYDSRREKMGWYALMVAAHAGAAFDAWSTRRALSGNWGTEADPLMRPFAHSGTIYVATQVGPLLMDLLGRRAMVSEHPWVRKFWWMPQTISASMSFQAATHNVGVVH